MKEKQERVIVDLDKIMHHHASSGSLPAPEVPKPASVAWSGTSSSDQAPHPASAPTATAPTHAPPPKMVPFLRLFRYLQWWECPLLFLGIVCAAAQGAGWPIWSVWFGESVGKFDPDDLDSVVDEIIELAIKFAITGALLGIVTGTYVWIFSSLAAKQSSRMRIEYIRSLLRQDMTWHDANPSAGLDIRLTTRIPKVQEAISTKLGDCIHQIFEGFFGIAVSFWFSWKLTLVFFAVSPVMLMSMAFFASAVQSIETAKASAYERAGIAANEILKLIRTIMALGTFDREERRYGKEITASYVAGTRFGVKLGLAIGLPDFSLFVLFAVAFWYGATLVESGEISGEDIIIVMFANMIGFFALGQSLTHFRLVVEGRMAAAEIFEVIDRESEIDGLSDTGDAPASLAGTVEFRDVVFAYASNTDHHVLRGLSFRVEPGSTLALVGPSGSGKSTVISLIERFYSPASGSILLDGRPLDTFNIQWLRNRVGLVTQTPTLMPASIYDNIAIGKVNASEDDVVRAAKLAHAHDFISAFPQGYQTNVGDLGGQLSGGQKQRIAIARVLINDPKILLLDEATSALDNSSEKAVQAALDEAKKGRTTIAVAHRLSTIRNADAILVLQDGVLKESGSHEKLMEAQGLYYEMVERDRASSATDSEAVSHDASSSHSTEDASLTVVAAHSPDAIVNLQGAHASGTSSSDSGLSVGTLEPAANGSGRATPKSSESTHSSSLEKVLSSEEEKALALDGVTGAYRWAWKVARPDAFMLGLCFLGAIIGGSAWPAFSVVVSKAANEAIGPNRSYEIMIWSIGFLVISAANLGGHWLRSSAAFYAGERLTLRLRQRLFRGILRQPAAWFDDEANGSAVLMHRLAEDVTHVRELVGDSISMIIFSATMIFGGMIIAFVSCWRTALVMVFTVPVVAAAGIIIFKMQLSTGAEEKGAFKNSAAVGSEIISNIRLITSLGKSASKVQEYRAAIKEPVRVSLRTAWKLGFGNFFAQFSNLGSFALAFYYSSVVVDDGQCSFDQTFRGLNGIIFCSIVAGMYASQIPDMKRASQATARIMGLLSSMEENPPAERIKPQGSTPVSAGAIELRNVHFAYPSRPDAQVLSGFSLSIPAGKTVALVGPSGCGKSTVCGLLQKMYTPTSGEILVDGRRIEDLATQDLRSQLGVVEQEPRLFSATLMENIRYSIRDGEQVPEASVLDAARAANVHEFAATLSSGFDTQCGELGALLSGGQRQRVAIARALVRDERLRVLLLDEATSALDVHNEKLVHDAIERARKGRTTILVAHRLSTVKNADIIVVVDKGRVAEQGTHEELLQRGGFYADLYSRSTE